MNQFTPLQWQRQRLKILSLTAALWGLRVSPACARQASARAEKCAAPSSSSLPLRRGGQSFPDSDSASWSRLVFAV